MSGFLGGSDSKESAYNTGDPGSIPGSGRYPRERNGYPLQCSCLENSMDRGVWGLQSMESQRWTRLSEYIHCVYMSVPFSRFSPPAISSLGIHTFVLYIYVSISALQIRLSVAFSKIPHKSSIIHLLFFLTYFTLYDII